MGFKTNGNAEPVTNVSISLKSEKPGFYIRDDGKLQEFLGTVFEGKFESIGYFNYDGDDGERKIINIRVSDEDGNVFSIGTSLTSAGRAILNTIIGSKNNIDKLAIGIYQKEGNDGKLYTQSWTKINGDRSDWMISIDEQNNLIEKATLGGKTVRDYSKLNEKLITELDSFIEKNGFNKTKDSVADDDVDNDEDLPF